MPAANQPDRRRIWPWILAAVVIALAAAMLFGAWSAGRPGARAGAIRAGG